MPVKWATITHFAIPNLNLHDKTQDINIKKPGNLSAATPVHSFCFRVILPVAAINGVK